MIFGVAVSDEFRKYFSYRLTKASTGATNNRSETDTIAWTASISRTRVSTMNGLSINQNFDFEAIDGLEGLSRTTQQFVNTMEFPGVGLERVMLRGLFERTLHTDPSRRIADLSKLPIMEIWHKAPGGRSLKLTLAAHTRPGRMQYSMFEKKDDSYIPWPQQQTLL